MSPEQAAEKMFPPVYGSGQLMHDYNEPQRAAFLSGVSWQRENGWISVETELPEVGEKVLIAIDTDYVLLMGQLMTNGWAAFYLDGLKLTSPSIVTHWQKLPSLPDKTTIV